MKFNEINPGKKYYKVSCTPNGRRGKPLPKKEDTIFVLQVCEQTKRVLASINQLPAQWYLSSVYAKWVSEVSKIGVNVK